MSPAWAIVWCMEGNFFAGLVRIDDATIEAIDKLTLLAPLHQPHSLRLIRAIRELRPDLPSRLLSTRPSIVPTAKFSGASPGGYRENSTPSWPNRVVKRAMRGRVIKRPSAIKMWQRFCGITNGQQGVAQ